MRDLMIKKKNIFFVLVILFVFAIISGPLFSVITTKADNVQREEKILCTATLEDDFDDSSVLVVLDKENSAINKVHTAEEFGLDDNCTIKDLTYLEGDISEYKYLNRENFRQILQIQLPICSKENVLNT